MQPAEYHDQQQIDTGDADEGEHLLVGSAVDGLSGVDHFLAADDSDEGGVLQQHDELVAEGGENGLECLRNDDQTHGVDVAEAKAPPGFGLTRVKGHETAPDDLGDVSAGIDAQRQRAHHGVVPGEGEDNEAHDQQLHHHGRAADDGDVYLADAVEQAENGVLVPCPLLVVGGPDHGHHNAEENAQCQRHGCDQQGGANAVQVLLPAAPFDKCLIEFDVEFLPEGCGAVPHQGFPKFVKFHSFTFSFNIAQYRVIRRKSAFPARRSVFRVQPCQGRLEPPLAKRLDYSAEMYLSTMD